MTLQNGMIKRLNPELSLDIDQIPRGTKARIHVQCARSGLGYPISVPIIVARGEKPGPVFGISAAIHGNELNGIPVIQRLIDRLDIKLLKGCVVGILVANVPAFHMQQREYYDEVDLNHVFPGKEGGTCSELYANRLLERIVKHLDYLVDLHTASFGRANCLYVRADMTDAVTERMAYLQRPQIIVHNPPSDHTLRGAACELGIPAITVEIGDPQRFQPEYIKRSIIGLRAVLAEVGMIAKRKVSMSSPPILCTSSSWLYTTTGGLLEVLPSVRDLVKKDDTIARIANVFGDIVQEYYAPEDGIVIGKSTNPVAQTGSRILHLGILKEDEKVLPNP